MVPPGYPWAFPGPPGACRRPSGRKRTQSKKPKNLKELTERWSTKLCMVRRLEKNTHALIRSNTGTKAKHVVMQRRDCLWRSHPETNIHPHTIASNMHPMVRNSASGPEIGFPGRSAGFQSGKPQIGPSAGRRPAGWLMLRLSRLQSGRNPAWKTDFRPGNSSV